MKRYKTAQFTPVGDSDIIEKSAGRSRESPVKASNHSSPSKAGRDTSSAGNSSRGSPANNSRDEKSSDSSPAKAGRGTSPAGKSSGGSPAKGDKNFSAGNSGGPVSTQTSSAVHTTVV
jgi:hypothetical protein